MSDMFTDDPLRPLLNRMNRLELQTQKDAVLIRTLTEINLKTLREMAETVGIIDQLKRELADLKAVPVPRICGCGCRE